MDEAWRGHGITSRMEFLRRAIAQYLQQLGEAQAAEAFTQHNDGCGSTTAVDIFAGVLASVVQGDKERVLADRALLDTCLRFARAARAAYTPTY